MDTSVIGGCLDDEFALESRAFLQLAHDGVITILISDITDKELQRAPVNVRVEYNSLQTSNIEPLMSSYESEKLRDVYIKNGFVGQNQKDDAHHVAIATIADTDLIVSWNFKHLVHIEKIRGFNAVNIREGYKTVDIRSPEEVI